MSHKPNVFHHGDPSVQDRASLYPTVITPIAPVNTLLDDAYRERRLERAIQKKRLFVAAHDTATLSNAGKWQLGYHHGRVNTLMWLDNSLTEPLVSGRLHHTEAELAGVIRDPEKADATPFYLGELHGTISVLEDIVQTYDDIREGRA